MELALEAHPTLQVPYLGSSFVGGLAKNPSL